MGQWALRTVEGRGWRAAAAVLGEHPRLRPVLVLSPPCSPSPPHTKHMQKLQSIGV